MQHEALCAVGHRRPEGRRYRPGLLARAVDPEARHGSLLHTDTGAAMVKEDGVHIIDWGDVVGAARYPEGVLCPGRPGRMLHPRRGAVFRGSDPVRDEALRRLDPALVFEVEASGV